MENWNTVFSIRMHWKETFISLSLSHFSLTYKYLLKKKTNSQLVQTNNLDLCSITWKKDCEYLILPGNLRPLLISWERHSKGEPNLCNLTYISFVKSQSVASSEHILSQCFYIFSLHFLWSLQFFLWPTFTISKQYEMTELHFNS